MSDRRAELERKKAKLQAMREEKRRKEEEKKKKETVPKESPARTRRLETTATPAATQPAQSDLRQETEQMLADLGIPPPSEGGSGPSRPSSLVPAATTQQTTMRNKKITLTTSQVTQTNIPPREMVSYSKETQTQVVEREAYGVEARTKTERYVNQGTALDYYVISGSNLSTASSSPSSTPSGRLGQSRSSSLSHYGSPRFVYPHLEWDDEFPLFLDDDNDSMEVAVDTPPNSANLHKMPQVEQMKPAETSDDIHTEKTVEPPPVCELTEEEREKIMQRDDFQRFLDRSTRVLERAIFEGADILTDYSGGEDDQGESGLGEGEKLKLNRQFYDERWSKHRTITSLDWSTQHPELLVASYNNNEESPHEPDGVALIWNIKYNKGSPEYIFHCQSAVMSSCFAKFHPNLVVGGTYSGQIVLWDNRSNKKTPVQRTPLSAAAHTHPVYCVNVVGTQNSHNLISVSTDGKMCSWSLDMLSHPQDNMELQHKQSRAAAVTSLSFLSGDVNNFVVGSEEAAVYTACRHGSKAGINDMFEGHQGPITGIDCHTVPGQIDFSPYFITSSFDWTVKLWSIKEKKPLHSFEDNSDYVYDARWSPIHPALFATVDGMGRLDMWNLNNDTEVPTASTIVDTNAALNKCLWHQNGHSIAVGDDLGRLYIYDVGETLAIPKSDEWPKFVHTLQELQANKAEQEEEALNFGTSLLR